MRKILMKAGISSVILSVIVATVLATMFDGEAAALGAIFGGTLAGTSFIGLIYVVTGLVAEQTQTREKLSMLTVMLVKLGLVGFGFWYGLIKLQLSPSGTALGIGGSILGLTLGLNKATSSPEAKEVMEREEARILAELEKDEKRG